MRFSEFIELVKVEYMMVAAEILRRKAALFTIVAWPYVLMLFVVIIGSIMGGFTYFQQNVGVNPLLFFITGSYLLMTSLAFFDEIASRFLYDEFIGTLPYVIISPTSKVVLALTMGIPRLIINVLMGLTSLIPIYVYLRGPQGVLDAFVVILLSIFSALTFATLAAIFASIVLISGGKWRAMNILRPLMLLLSGVMYPRYLLPLITKLITGFVPLAHSVEVIQLFIRYNVFSEYMFMLMGIVVALAIIYLPISMKG
ncbi:MAG TPA: hypothetical protein ENF75_01630, partial [Acidilobales archaeon]|nr:hypothetical protein [Acidilobales archaeon]